MPNISSRELEDHLGSKESMVDFMLRLDFYLPKMNSPLCTNYFMTGAYEDKLYCPKQSVVNVCHRVGVPTNDVLKAELIEAIDFNLDNNELGAKLFELRRHLSFADGDKQWMLTMLRHLKSDHRFFSKNYEPRKQKKNEIAGESQEKLDIVAKMG
jgi:hypothetical protein